MKLRHCVVLWCFAAITGVPAIASAQFTYQAPSTSSQDTVNVFNYFNGTSGTAPVSIYGFDTWQTVPWPLSASCSAGLYSQQPSYSTGDWQLGTFQGRGPAYQITLGRGNTSLSLNNRLELNTSPGNSVPLGTPNGPCLFLLEPASTCSVASGCITSAYFKWSTYISSAAVITDGLSAHDWAGNLFQMHSVDQPGGVSDYVSGSGPQLTIEVDGAGNPYLVFSAQCTAGTTGCFLIDGNDPSSTALDWKAYLSAGYVGRWVDFAFYIKLSTGSDGVETLWVDGQQVISWTGPNVYNSASGHPRLNVQHGYYRLSKATSTLPVYQTPVLYSTTTPIPPGGGGSCTQSHPAVATLTDSFGGSSIDTSKWAAPTQTQGTVTESGGYLHETPNANTASASLFLGSNGTYSLIGSSAYVHAAQVVSSGGGVDTNFTLLSDSANLVSWIFDSGTLYARKVVGGVDTRLATLTYSATNHAWWRIRESSGAVYWETSPDGQAWTVQANALTSNVPFVCGIKVDFFTETWGSGSPSPGEARYANLNVPASANPWTDSFAGTSIDATKWTIFTFDGGTATEGGGVVSLTPRPSTSDSVVQIKSVNSASLIGNEASVHAVAVVNGANDCDEDFSLILTGRSNRVTWFYEHGLLGAEYFVNGVETTLVTLTYSPTNHAYWRIRESGGTVSWDTSADRVTWTQQASTATANLFSLTSLQAQLYAETWSANSAAPGSAQFADMR